MSGCDFAKMNRIIDKKNTAEDNFNNILTAADNVLSSVILTFSNHLSLNGIDDLMHLLKYDYRSLKTIIVYGLLNFLGITYSENLSQKRTIDNMKDMNFYYSTDKDMNRKRIERLKNLYNKRNTSHISHLNTSSFTPKILVEDSLWYELLSDFPILKRFLHNEEAIITKHFFDDMNSVYAKINTYSGYDRFKLMHKLEMNSKIELFYKILSSIKKEKKRLKLSKEDVDKKLISPMKDFHTVNFNYPDFADVARNSGNMIFNEILKFDYYEKTISNIIFNVDELVECYVKYPEETLNFVKMLNYIHYAVVFHLDIKIETELLNNDSQQNFSLIKNIQHCEDATIFFDEYIDSISFANMDKNCSKDITFTHFKKIYKLKPEKSSKKNN